MLSIQLKTYLRASRTSFAFFSCIDIDRHSSSILRSVDLPLFAASLLCAVPSACALSCCFACSSKPKRSINDGCFGDLLVLDVVGACAMTGGRNQVGG